MGLKIFEGQSVVRELPFEKLTSIRAALPSYNLELARLSKAGTISACMGAHIDRLVDQAWRMTVSSQLLWRADNNIVGVV